MKEDISKLNTQIQTLISTCNSTQEKEALLNVLQVNALVLEGEDVTPEEVESWTRRR